MNSSLLSTFQFAVAENCQSLLQYLISCKQNKARLPEADSFGKIKLTQKLK